MAKGRPELAARSAVAALGLLVGGCTALLGVTDVTEAVDASDGGGGPGVSGDATAADGTMARGGDAGVDFTGQEAATPDAGDSGGPGEAGPCLATDLLCDGGCVPNDTHHCGTCGNDCTALKNVSGPVSCISGACSFLSSSCAPGSAHCGDAGTAAGCETDLSMPSNCGACGQVCSGVSPLCSGSGAAFMCVSGCPVGTSTLCGGSSCVDTTSSAGHCGSCTIVCTSTDPHAQPACVGSACTVTCSSGYSLCPPDVCVDEQSDTGHCGACGTTCTGASPVCLNGVCAACTPGAARCIGAVRQTCDSSGLWQSAACGPHQTCASSAGAACACVADPVCNALTAAGPVCVDPTHVTTCAKDSQGCWFQSASPMACVNGACSGGACCTNACMAGATACLLTSSAQIQSCAAGANGCTAHSTSACGAGLVCERTGGAACVDPSWAEWPTPNSQVDVTAGAPNPESYTDNGDGTVTDKVTGLVWQQGTAPLTYTQAAAVQYCAGLMLGGASAWRLPSEVELFSLVDVDLSAPAINAAYFPGTISGAYWSSTPVAGSSGYGWVVYFNIGGEALNDMATTPYYARCLR